MSNNFLDQFQKYNIKHSNPVNIGNINYLIHKTFEDDNYSNKNDFLKNTLKYIEDNQIIKNKGFYQILIKVYGTLGNLKEQESYLQEMLQNGHEVKISTYEHILYNIVTNYSENKEKVNLLFNNLLQNNLCLNSETFDLFLKFLSNNYDKSLFVKLLKKASNDFDIIKSKYLIEMISNNNLTNKEILNYNILKPRVISKEEYQKLYNDWISSSSLKKIDLNSIETYCNDLLINDDKKIVVIDGANIGYFKNRKRLKNKNEFFFQIDRFVKYLKEKDYNVVIILYYKHMLKKYLNKYCQNIIEKWNSSENVKLYSSDKNIEDDIFWITFSLYLSSKCSERIYVLTNDIMRNHHKSLNTKMFFRWKDLHQLFYDINDEIQIIFPPSYSHYIQYDEGTGSYYIPMDINKLSVKKKGERLLPLYKANYLKFQEYEKVVKWLKIKF